MIEIISVDNPQAPIEARHRSAALRSDLADLYAAEHIDLDREDTRESVQSLETNGVLAVGRAKEILDAPVLDQERYRP